MLELEDAPEFLALLRPICLLRAAGRRQRREDGIADPVPDIRECQVRRQVHRIDQDREEEPVDRDELETVMRSGRIREDRAALSAGREEEQADDRPLGRRGSGTGLLERKERLQRLITHEIATGV
jgi:hypothetical protein